MGDDGWCKMQWQMCRQMAGQLHAGCKDRQSQLQMLHLDAKTGKASLVQLQTMMHHPAVSKQLATATHIAPAAAADLHLAQRRRACLRKQ